MLSENQIVTIALSVIGGIGAAIVSACGTVWALVRFLLDVKIERAIEEYDKDTIQQRCKDHKAESRNDLQEIKESQRLAREESRATSGKIFSLLAKVDDKLFELAKIKGG